jgi:hypothetical protein
VHLREAWSWGRSEPGSDPRLPRRSRTESRLSEPSRSTRIPGIPNPSAAATIHASPATIYTYIANDDYRIDPNHLATAISLGRDLGAVCVYDGRLSNACRREDHRCACTRLSGTRVPDSRYSAIRVLEDSRRRGRGVGARRIRSPNRHMIVRFAGPTPRGVTNHRELSGLMSVQLRSMRSRQSDFGAGSPTVFQPAGTPLPAGQTESYSSWYGVSEDNSTHRTEVPN